MILDCPRCTECSGQLEYFPEWASFACENTQCAGAGVELSVWRVLRRTGLSLDAPAGLPRPQRQGLPVPWVTPATASTVYWKALDAGRLASAQADWLCQFCGVALPSRAWVLATPEGRVLQAALHKPCLEVSRRSCPHLAGPATRSQPVLVSRAELLAAGVPLDLAPRPTADSLQAWEVAEGVGVARSSERRSSGTGSALR